MKQTSKWESLEINDKIHSRNAVDKWHWAKKHRLKHQYQFQIRSEMNENDIFPTCEKCEIKITVYLKRLYDYDNLYAGIKQFLDALCIERFIHDDSPKWLEIVELKQEKASKFKILVERKVVS